jgi:hypothetical protein
MIIDSAGSAAYSRTPAMNGQLMPAVVSGFIRPPVGSHPSWNPKTKRRKMAAT